MIKTTIGENAGKIWSIIDENGEMLFTELMNLTKLNEKELLMAIGWLSREGKIFQTNPFKKNWSLCLISE
ncbi:MAG: winged helix-turn-helix domain-containing protein [Bacteroidales bacterium]|nr:winged helix-turn-helix domain-containing protein [Bacteroidales bacterium]